MIIILDTKDELFWQIEYYIVLQFLDHFFQIALILILFSHTLWKNVHCKYEPRSNDHSQ